MVGSVHTSILNKNMGTHYFANVNNLAPKGRHQTIHKVSNDGVLIEKNVKVARPHKYFVLTTLIVPSR